MCPKLKRLRPQQETEAVEIVDGGDRPLAVMSLSEAHRQSLRHRTVLVLVYNPEGKVYIQKRSRSKRLYPGRWDISVSGHVLANESREDAALRELDEELGIRQVNLKFWRAVEAAPETGYEFVTLYSAGLVDQNPKPRRGEVEGGFFADPGEISYLVSDFRDQLTPGLVYCWKKGLIFPSWPEENFPSRQSRP